MSEQFQYDVFLSYSSKDKEVVHPLAERLRQDGVKVWFDEWEIKPGDNISAKIEEGLERSRVLVLCMSQNAFDSEWAQLEAGTFRFRDPLNKERRFIPLRIDDAPIKGSLAQCLYIDWMPVNRGQEYSGLLAACRHMMKSMPERTCREIVEEVADERGPCERSGFGVEWAFQDLPDHQTRAYHRRICEHYTSLHSFDLLVLCGEWRLLAEGFTNDAYVSGRYGAHVVHDLSIDTLTRLLETACADRGLPDIDRLSRCLRRPDNCHVHFAIALLDDLEARLRAETLK